ncbi:MAG TPA: chemotaxis protein CheW [Terriglobales bacterium]|nr:chemotaxis protein CheW [Terriglobales bacterium]
MRPAEHKSYVLFPLGKKRFALPAETVSELARPDRLQEFPHTTPLLAGVLVRRGRILPVFDIAQVLAPTAVPRRFYLIANRWIEGASESAAIPVSGECELASLAMIPPAGRLPSYVTALLPLKEELVEVLDLEALAATEESR